MSKGDHKPYLLLLCRMRWGQGICRHEASVFSLGCTCARPSELPLAPVQPCRQSFLRVYSLWSCRLRLGLKIHTLNAHYFGWGAEVGVGKQEFLGVLWAWPVHKRRYGQDSLVILRHFLMEQKESFITDCWEEGRCIRGRLWPHRGWVGCRN